MTAESDLKPAIDMETLVSLCKRRGKPQEFPPLPLSQPIRS